MAGREFLLVVELFLLLLLDFLSQFDLLSPALFKLSLLFEELLLLLHGSFHGFVSSKHFLLHLVEAFECLGGLFLLLLLDLLFLLELLNESSFFFFCHLGLSFDLSFLLFKLLFDFELFLFDLVRHLLHFFLIFDVGDTTTASSLAVSAHALGLASLAEVNLATRELCKLIS